MGAGASSPPITDRHGRAVHGGVHGRKLGSSSEGMSLNEENELLLEASHLMEGDILRMFNYIEGEGFELDTKRGVMTFLSSVLQSENLLKVCEHVLLHQTGSSHATPNHPGGQSGGHTEPSAKKSSSAGEAAGNNNKPPNDDVDGRAIVTGLWNFLTMDHTRLTGFMFSLYENVGKGFQGMGLASMREIVGDLHKEGEDHPMFIKMTETAKGDPPTLAWDDFRRMVLADKEKEFLGPIFDSQLTLRQHLLGEEFWQRRQQVRSEVIGGTVIVGDELNELGRDGASGRSTSLAKRHTVLTVPDAANGKRRISSALLGHNQHVRSGSSGGRSSIFTRHSGKVSAIGKAGGPSIEEIPLAKRDSTHSQRAKSKSIVFSIPSGTTLHDHEGGAKDGHEGAGGRASMHGLFGGGGTGIRHSGLAYSEAKRPTAHASLSPSGQPNLMTPVMTSYASKATSHLMGGGGGGDGGGAPSVPHGVESSAGGGGTVAEPKYSASHLHGANRSHGNSNNSSFLGSAGGGGGGGGIGGGGRVALSDGVEAK